MSKISKFSLKPKIKREIVENLWKALFDFKNSKELETFLGNILTPAEIEMISKRLEALKMLASGKTYAQIGDKLHMSSVTLSRLNNRLRADKEFERKIKALS